MNSATTPASSATDELIDLLRAIRPNYGAVGSRDVDVTAQRQRIDRAIELLASQPVAAAPAAQAATMAETEMADRLRRIVTNIGEGPIAVTSKLLLQAADECDRFYNGMMNWKETAQAKDRIIIEQRAALQQRQAPAQAPAIPEGWMLVRKSRLAEITEAAVDPSENAYEGRGLYDDRIIRKNWEACSSRLDNIKEQMHAINEGWDDEDLDEALAQQAEAAPVASADKPAVLGKVAEAVVGFGHGKLSTDEAYAAVVGAVAQAAPAPADETCARCGEPRNRHLGTCAMMCREGMNGEIFTPAAPAPEAAAPVAWDESWKVVIGAAAALAQIHIENEDEREAMMGHVRKIVAAIPKLAAPVASQPAGGEEAALEFVQAIAYNYTVHDDGEDESYCRGCSALVVVAGAEAVTNHQPGCIVPRAEKWLAERAALAATPATQQEADK